MGAEDITGLKLCTDVEGPIYRTVEERSVSNEAAARASGGGYRSDNVGMSNAAW